MYIKHEVVTKGIVVFCRAAGEGSVRVFMYTERLGLVAALAKSAREERSKLRAHLQEGTSGTFALVKGRETWRVTGATGTTNVFFSRARDAASQEAAARVFRAIRQFVHGEIPDPYLWQALQGFTAALPEERGGAENTRALEELAVIRLLASLGYVRENGATAAFLDAAYELATLERAARERPSLVRAINEAIAASGL